MIVRSADGTPISVERIGDGDGPPIVVVPGALSDVASWSACAPLLADGRSVHVVDRRGRGASGDADTYEVEREIEDVLAVLDGLEGPTDLLGHSSGAILALGAAERSPATLRRLVLDEPPVFIGEEDRIPARPPRAARCPPRRGRCGRRPGDAAARRAAHPRRGDRVAPCAHGLAADAHDGPDGAVRRPDLGGVRPGSPAADDDAAPRRSW